MNHTPVRLRRLAAVLVAAATLVAGPAAFPASAAAPPLYLGLGDSFAAGVGGETITDASCGRTLEAYPTVLGGSNRACGGATTFDVIQQARTLNPTTRKVSVTVGGNDVGALQTVAACLQGHPACLQMIEESERAATQDLPGRLTGVITAIRVAAPNATIVLTDYPHLFEIANLSGDLQALAARINIGVDVLNASISATAQANGVGFASVTTAFAGHSYPSADQWIHSPTEPGVGLHPTSAGYLLGYAPAVGAVLGPPVLKPALAR